MCGIAGLLDADCATRAEALHATASAMAGTLRHRGPDDAGVWVATKQGIALAHRRLAVIDLSPQGHQPMCSASGRFTIVFNGEIYNFSEVRRQLEVAGVVVSARSDTAVLLAACEHWGLEHALGRIDGMFAFALWDGKARQLTLVRDRLGEKPLYYGWLGRTLVFASELKALTVHPAWRGAIAHQALEFQLRYGYVPAPWSIYAGVHKLPPGTWLRFTAGHVPERSSAYADPEDSGVHHPQRYWALPGAQATATEHRGPEQVADELEHLLRRAIRQQMTSDVPVGAFLSGGIDSSTVVALMQAESSRPIKTFTVAFDQREFDESRHAAAVARHLGTDHTELVVTERQALETIPDLPMTFDEPFSDASQIPTLLISRLARKHVTVCLTGDGGDEMFCGYNRYHGIASVWRHRRVLPHSLTRGFGRLLSAVAPGTWDRLFAPFAPSSLRPPSSPGHRLHKLARLLSAADLATMYRLGVAVWPDPGTLLRSPVSPGNGLLPMHALARGGDPMAWMTTWDTMYYLPDDNLTKVDRASMSVGLEARLPLLDRHVVEYAWRLSTAQKLHGGMSKSPLRQVLYRHVPRSLIERPKMGFSAPIGKWLHGPLRDWAEELLDIHRVDNESPFDGRVIRACWEEHLNGRRNWQAELWAVLMYQAWKGSVAAGRVYPANADLITRFGVA